MHKVNALIFNTKLSISTATTTTSLLLSFSSELKSALSLRSLSPLAWLSVASCPPARSSHSQLYPHFQDRHHTRNLSRFHKIHRWASSRRLDFPTSAMRLQSIRIPLCTRVSEMDEMSWPSRDRQSNPATIRLRPPTLAHKTDAPPSTFSFRTRTFWSNYLRYLFLLF